MCQAGKDMSNTWTQSSGSLLLLISLVPVLVCISMTYNLFLHPLSHVPGPFWARASGIPSWYHAAKGRRHLWLLRQFRRYGDTIRPTPNTVLFCDAAAYADIYGARSNVRRSKFYTAFKRDERESPTMYTTDVAAHAAKRRLLNLCFTEKSLHAAAGFVVRHVDRWDELLVDAVRPNDWSAPVDLSRRLDALTFDIMGELSFGTSFGIKEPGDNPLKAVPRLIAAYLRFYYPLCRSPFLNTLVWLKPRGLDWVIDRISPSAVKQFHAFIDDSVKRRLALYREQADKPEAERRQDMLYFLCEARDPDTGLVAYDENDLRAEASLFVIGGTDTVGASLSGIFFYLTGDPARCGKLVGEITATFSSAEEIVYGSALLGCAYLQACVLEGMRLTPAAPCELPREVLPGGIVIRGRHYPAGTIVGTVPWANSRNSKVLGDADVFRPERWIVDGDESTTAESIAQLRANCHPFGSGPGSCAGKNLAMAEMMLVVARTLYRLDMRRFPGSTVGGGAPELGWGASDGSQFQLYDAFVSLRRGPEVQVRKRVPVGDSG